MDKNLVEYEFDDVIKNLSDKIDFYQERSKKAHGDGYENVANNWEGKAEGLEEALKLVMFLKKHVIEEL